MKSRFIANLARNIAVIAIMFLAGSCLEYTVNTTVNKDGSITREYIVTGDSSHIFDGSLMIPSGSQWHITGLFEDDNKQKDASDKQYTYTASRKFNNVAAFREWLASDTASNTIKIKVDLKRRFRWFYTYYEYTETYPMTFAFKKVPVDNLLTEIEQSVLMEDGRTVFSPIEKRMIWKRDTLSFKYNHADSVEMKRIHDYCDGKRDYWMAASIVTEFTDILKSNFINDPSIADITNELSQHIELIRDKAFSFDDSLLKMLIFVGDSLTQSKKLSAFYMHNPLVFSDFEYKVKIVDEKDYSDDYEYYLNMPGQVYSTNAFERDLIRMKWKFGPMQFFMKDFEMKTESRVTNVWIMVFTAIFAVGLVLILIVKRNH
jgi:hypothetical protein